MLKIDLLWWSLGGYDMEEKAARAYDLAALKYWGPSTHINFPVWFDSMDIICARFKDLHWVFELTNETKPCLGQLENYQKELEEMKNMTRQEYVAHLRR